MTVQLSTGVIEDQSISTERGLTVEEIGRVKAAGEGSPWEAAIWLALHTRARRGEILALTEDDIDLERGLVTISKSVVAVDNQRHERQGTKNGTVRRFRISPEVVAMLKSYKAGQKARQLRSRTWNTTNLVVVSRNGEAPRPRSLSQGWANISQNAGVTARFHDLRHTHATGLVRAGVDATEVARSVGHANANTALRVYAYVIDEMEPGSNVDFMAGLETKREA